MNHLILVRHGQSVWNLEKRFTGWVDIELSEQGKLEACKAGELIKKTDLIINKFFCSYQKRAIDTLNLILNTLSDKPNQIIKAWELNERHYGELTGLNKNQMKKVYGEIATDVPYLFFFNSKFGFYGHTKKMKRVKDTYSYGVGTDYWWIEK